MRMAEAAEFGLLSLAPARPKGGCKIPLGYIGKKGPFMGSGRGTKVGKGDVDRCGP